MEFSTNNNDNNNKKRALLSYWKKQCLHDRIFTEKKIIVALIKFQQNW